jgi:hypothetical protein
MHDERKGCDAYGLNDVYRQIVLTTGDAAPSPRKVPLGMNFSNFDVVEKF